MDRLWSGSSFSDAEGVLKDTIAEIPVILRLSTNDAATTNHCINAAEEEEHAASCVENQCYRLHLRMHCLGHQAALLTRPAGRSCGDLCTVLVRLGHILQGGRQLTKFHKALDAETDASFDFRPVLRLPAESRPWRRRARWMMTSSLISYDLTEEDTLAIMNFFNGDWREPTMRHYCLGQASCPAGCRDEEHAREQARAFTRMALGMGLVVPLEYRWKGMEKASGWALRGRALHDIMPRALARMWTRKQLLDAEGQAAAVADVGELSFQAKTALKANSVMRSFQSDPGNRLLVKMCLVARPLQRFLNLIQKTDGKLCKYMEASTYDPDDAATTVLRNECIELNRGLF